MKAKVNFSEPNAASIKQMGDDVAKQSTEILTKAGVGMVGSLLVSALTSLLVTNYTKLAIDGNQSLTPREDKASLSTRETEGTHQGNKLSSQEFKGQNSELKGANTDANTANATTNASNAYTAAAKTEAGAINTSATGMKLN